MGRPKKTTDKMETSGIKSEVLQIIQKYNKLPEIKWLRTGIHALDLMIGNGIPLARIIEVFGTESSGKSLLAWMIAKKIQEQGGIVMLADVEATAPKDFMEDLGLNTDLIIQIGSKTVEDIGAEIVERTLQLRETKFDGPIFVIWDSIACTSSDGEWKDGDIESLTPANNIGAKAKAMSEFLRQFTLFLRDYNVTLFCVNQVREKIGVMFGNKEDSPGGRALKFGASVRLRINRGAKALLKEKEIGYMANVFIEKNKVGVPHRGGKILIRFGEGYNPFEGLVELLELAGRIKTEKGGKFNYNGQLYDNEQIEQATKDHPELLNEWIRNNDGQIGSSGVSGSVAVGVEDGNTGS